jgi:hypothetical protein
MKACKEAEVAQKRAGTSLSWKSKLLPNSRHPSGRGSFDVCGVKALEIFAP